MGNPDREKWVCLRHQYNDIKGHLKWELIRTWGWPVVLALCAGFVRRVQHTPWWQVCGLVVVVFLLGCVFAFWLSRKSKAHHPAEAPSPEKSVIPPPAIYSALATGTKDTTLDQKTFEVLKWFSTFPRYGAAPVSHVAQEHGMDLSAALACVQKLWHLNYIRTAVVAPGEWNGQYAITDSGHHYVRTHAT
jgi:hypothetical protein